MISTYLPTYLPTYLHTYRVLFKVLCEPCVDTYYRKSHVCFYLARTGGRDTKAHKNDSLLPSPVKHRVPKVCTKNPRVQTSNPNIIRLKHVIEQDFQCSWPILGCAKDGHGRLLE